MTQTGYGPAQRCIFDGDEEKYEQWECKMLAYMKLRKLKHVILPGAPASAEKKEECFSELVGLLDDRSLTGAGRWKFSVRTTWEQENKESFPSTLS